MLYAGSAGVTGAVVGVLVGQWGFPTVIWNAYGIMYYYPGFQTAFLAKYAIPSAGASIISVLAATWWAVAESLHDNPARLMLPKAPKEGKRIWLEYVTPVWKHMKFTHKVTARNIFRYKKRFFMTIIGIAGCTALLVTGFGIRDSIGHIVSTQYGELQKYSLTVELEEDAAKKDVKALKEIIADQSEDYLAVHTETGTVRNGKEEESVTIEVPKDARRFSDFVSLRHRKDQKSVSFDENSVILTEKMADTLGLAVGDTFTLENNDDKTAELTVTEITENYIRGYVYIGKQAWETAFAGNDTEYRTWLVDSGASGDEEEEAQLRTLLSQEAVASASFSSSTIETFDNMLSKIDYIVIVLIFCAGLLAFIVLYNLTNINIGEREKEIATIKVLGFYNGEVNAYIFRETVLLSLFGALVGLVGGFFLHRFVILTVEVSAIMFGRKIFAASYLYAACITMIFTVMVSVVLSRKLKKISMVESMKSVD
jgi:putative ABC transport system permease protein